MKLVLIPVLAAAAVAAAGCGGSKSSQPSTQAAPATTQATATGAATTTGQGSGAGALQAEATAKAAGDIPDNQVFLVYRNAADGYSIKYPEGWAQGGSGSNVTIRDKNNIVRILVTKGAAATPAAVTGELASLKGATVAKPPAAIKLPGGPAVKVVYTTVSAPNPVTGKRVTLTVDRYYIAGPAGKGAVADVGTPVGVDNADAYRMMIESFRWK